MTTLNRIARGLGALTALGVIVVGVPAAMLTVLDADPRRLLPADPWPPVAEVPEFLWHRLRWAIDTGDFVILALILFGWVAWLGFVWMTISEFTYQVRNGAAAARERCAAVPPRRWIAGLVTAIILLGATSPAAAHTPGEQVVATAPHKPPRPDVGTLPDSGVTVAVPQATPGGIPIAEPASDTADCPTVWVVGGDTLWGLAERHLGDGRRYTDIVTLNRDRLTAGGPDRLQVGWSLLLPPDATNLPDPARSTSCADEGTVTVRAGDTLSAIAARELGDPEQWRAIFDANHRVPQPDGRALVDPDTILPGWTLRIPTGTEASDDRTADTPEPPDPQAPPELDRRTQKPEALPTPPDPNPTPTSQLDRAPTSPPEQTSASPNGDDTPPDSGPETVTLPSGAIVSLSLAAAIATLLLLSRRRTRARTSAISPQVAQPAGPTVAALVRAAHHAHNHEDDRGDDGDDPDEIDGADDTSTPAAGPIGVGERRRVWPPPDVVVTGHAPRGTVRVRLADVAGLGLTGAGAPAAARAILATVATADTLHPALVRIAGTDTLHALTEAAIPLEEAATQLPGAIASEESMVLRWLEAEIARRLRLLAERDTTVDDPPEDMLGGERQVEIAAYRDADPSEDLPQIIACATPDPATLPRWSALCELGRSLGIHALLLTGDTDVHLTVDAQGAATGHDNATDPLTGTRLDTLTTDETAEIARLLDATRRDPTPEVIGSAPVASDEPATDTTYPARPPCAVSDVEPVIVVRMLGGVTVDSHASHKPAPISGLRSAAREALAYLACHQRGVRAETMAEDLLPGADPDKQRNHLYSAISHARRALRAATGLNTAFVITTDGRYHLDPEQVGSDIVELEAVLRSAHRSGEDTESTGAVREALLRAAEFCRDGPPLDGETYDWAERVADTWRTRTITTLTTLVDTITDDDPDTALTALDAITAWDPYAEDLHRRVIALRLRLSHHDAARATYRQLRARLADIDLEPSPETERLISAGNNTNGSASQLFKGMVR
ncbi:LysM peptidoglycan-binding domain-containing protein [Haloechinothrix halophila]|uniref:LysM peptidoglycan-binding domain-containing protein n=1 Tax=Haloechinothrix halophila TaxID=1069073 RepID=UPI00041B76A8|nr:LysM peptidoglycan-binding domain-containing protein [Haloechinothrix halophila]